MFACRVDDLRVAQGLLDARDLKRRKMHPTQTPSRHAAIAACTGGHQTRNLEPVVDAMYAPAATFDAWCAAVAKTAVSVFAGSIEASVVSIQGRPKLRVEDSSKTLRICGELTDNKSVVLSVRHDRERRLLQYERALLLRMALHLENAAWHKTTRYVRGTIGFNDRALVLNDRDPQRLWLDLSGGRASLACTDVHVNRYFILDAPPCWERHRALTETEMSSVILSATGMPYKEVANELDISIPSVSRALSVAAAKIGVRTPLELLRIASQIAVHCNPGELEDDALTEAEREVLALVLAGYANRAIAQLRGRSSRTIANQVASVLRKTGCTSRRALVRLRGPS